MNLAAHFSPSGPVLEPGLAAALATTPVATDRWTAVATGLPQGVLSIAPIAGGVRMVARTNGAVSVVEWKGDRITERASWTISATTEVWASGGLRGEALIAFRHANGAGGVLVFGGSTSGFVARDLAGPAVVDAAGGVVLMHDARNGTTPPTTSTQLATDRVNRGRITDLLTGPRRGRGRDHDDHEDHGDDDHDDDHDCDGDRR